MMQRGIILILLVLSILVSSCSSEEQAKPKLPTEEEKAQVAAQAQAKADELLAAANMKAEEAAAAKPQMEEAQTKRIRVPYDNDQEMPQTTLEAVTDPRRQKMQQLIRSVIGKEGTIEVEGKTHPAHCSGMVRAIYGTMGVDLYYKSKKYSRYEGAVRVIHGSFQEHQWTDKTKMPKAGDLIFFSNTWDQDSNGVWDDPLTHVGLVEGVEEGTRTVSIIHSVNSGIRRYRINLDEPTVYMKDGKKMNDFLRRRPDSDEDRTKYLSGVLFHSYIDILGPAK